MPLFHSTAVRPDRFTPSSPARPAPVEALEGRVMLDATVTLAAAGPSIVKFVDQDGSNSSIKITGPGTVTVQLVGAVTQQSTKGKTVNIDGTPTSVSALATG